MVTADSGVGDGASADTVLAFLGCRELEDGNAYRGGALVVDRTGRPLEFRCTSPIRPNKVQKTLYGRSLRPYMLCELMGLPLLKALRQELSFVLVSDPDFLLVRESYKRPVLYIREHGQTIVGPDGQQEDAKAELIELAGAAFRPFIAQCHSDHEDDLRVFKEAVTVAFARVDPLEPFERITRALEEVHRQKAMER